MTDRDPIPTTPDCPVCDSNGQVQRHDNPHQGRYLCMACMLLFDGTSAEWHRPVREHGDLSGLEAARAALREAAER